MTHQLPTTYQQFIATSRYSRWRDDLGRRENWQETVDRYFDFFSQRLEKQDRLTAEVAEGLAECRDAVLKLEVLPSMRALMTAGKALDRDEVASFNCSYVAIDHPHAFDEIMYVLMCGTGVGFSVEAEDVAKLPELPSEFHPTDTVIAVSDSKIGWATSYRELISMLYAGKVPKWDVSKIRPAGARLKTFGGRASGPDPLVNLFSFTVKVFKGAVGRKLKPIECHDIVCKVAEIVVVGGVRRSALISLSDLGDNEMRHCKSGSWWENNVQRALANNSAVYGSKPEIGQFMEEWLSLYRSGSGERGIFNRYVAQRYITELPNRDSNYKFGANPCCVTGDCPILTDEGYIEIANLVGTKTNIWNGEEFTEVTPFHAGVADIWRVSFSDGTYLDCTSNHKFVLAGGEFMEAFGLSTGDKLEKFPMPVVEGFETPEVDAYSQGFYSGDGNTGLEFSWVYEPKYQCLDRLAGTIGGSGKYGRKTWKHGPMLEKGYVPVNATVEYKLNWLAGLLDADGTVTKDQNGNGLQLTSINLDFLREARLMLTTLGVRAKIVSGSESGPRSMPDGRGGCKDYICKTTWRLLIGNTDTYNLINLGIRFKINLGIRFNRLSVHGNPPQRDARQFVKVVSVDQLDFATDVYCFTEPKKHTGTFNGIVTGQSEILLRSAQFCNLSSVQIAPEDTLLTLRKKVKVATILGTLQSSLTNFRYLRKVWRRNSEEERLLGVSLSGICDNDMMSNPYHGSTLKETLSNLREYAREVNADWAEKIGINPSAAITCVKPEGTTSQLADRSSGIHPRYSRYYIRTVRADKKDPLAMLMKDAGFPVEDDVTKPDSTYVFSFPMKSPEFSKMRDDMSAIDQLVLWLAYKKYWADHTVSCTIYVRENEWIQVAAWVYKHFDDISGLSFLPHSNHVYKQAPYTECTKEEYELALAAMPTDIDWNALSRYEKSDETVGAQELACSGNSCELI